jgi:hypothetical protein
MIHIHIHMDENDPYIHICMDVKRCWFCRVNLLVMENSLGTPTHASIIFWQTAGMLILSVTSSIVSI